MQPSRRRAAHAKIKIEAGAGGLLMKRNWVVAMLVTGVLLGLIPAFGHHSFAAEFDDTKPIKVKGTIPAMRWSNPHAWSHSDDKGSDVKVANHAIDRDGINQAC